MKIDFITLLLISIGISYLIGFIKDRSKNKAIRVVVAKYIDFIKTYKNALIAMEYNDRYTMIFNMGEMSKLGMVRLLKSEKKLIVLDDTFQLTDKEYENILDSLKPVL